MLDEFMQESQRGLAAQARLQLAVTGIAEYQAAKTIAAVMRCP